MSGNRGEHGLGMTTIALTTAIGTLLTGVAALGFKVVDPMDVIGTSREEPEPTDPVGPDPEPAGSTRAEPAVSTEPEPEPEPELWEISEEVELVVDGEPVGAWYLDESSPDGALDLELTEGEHDYELLGTYVAYDEAGIAIPWDVTGGGTIDVLDGDVYEVAWDPVAGFSLELV
jgi:hypothetical protein